MIVEIEGTDLPGRCCGPNPQGYVYENIHVGIGERRNPIELVPGDAASARWRVEVTTRRASDGSMDFRGPLVEGKRGDRFIYLNWGSVAADGSFDLFRRAKLSLSDVDPTLVERVLENDEVLACTVALTDAKGHPRCARVRAPDIAWRAIVNGA